MVLKNTTEYGVIQTSTPSVHGSLPCQIVDTHTPEYREIPNFAAPYLCAPFALLVTFSHYFVKPGPVQYHLGQSSPKLIPRVGICRVWQGAKLPRFCISGAASTLVHAEHPDQA